MSHSQCITCGEKFQPEIWRILRCKKCTKKAALELAATDIKDLVKSQGNILINQK